MSTFRPRITIRRLKASFALKRADGDHRLTTHAAVRAFGWRLTGCGEAFRAHAIAYADDFVILSRGRAAKALAWTKAVMTRLGLTLSEAKASLRNAQE